MVKYLRIASLYSGKVPMRYKSAWEISLFDSTMLK